MTLYIVFGIIAFVLWAFITGNLIVEAFDYPDEPHKARRARLAILSFFLLPVYPAVVIVALIVGPIWVFRRLGRINKEEEETE